MYLKTMELPNEKWTIRAVMFPIVIFNDENGEPTEPYEIKNGKYVKIESKPLNFWQKIKFRKERKELRKHITKTGGK